jgi:hypothetical protein
MADDRADRRVRDWFDERAAGPVPDSLRERLAAVPAEQDNGGTWTFVLNRIAGAVTGIAIVALLAVAIGILGSSQRSGVGATPSPSPIGFGLTAGDGVVELGIPWLPILATILALAALVATWDRGRLIRLAGVAAVGLVLAGDVVLGAGPRLVWRDGAVAAGPAFVEWQDTAEPGNGFGTMVFAPGAHGTFAFAVTVTNGGPTALTILGIDRAEVQSGVAFPQIVGLGTPADPQITNGDPRTAFPVRSIRLDPGQQVDLVFLGDAGPCAASSVTGSAIGYGIPPLRLVTEELGWPRVDTLSVPFGVLVRGIDNCGAEGPINPSGSAAPVN